MARRTTAQLTANFEDGDTIDGTNFSNVFDSSLNLEDDTTKVCSGSITMVDGDINISGSLSVTSSIARGDWEDGSNGNSSFIAIMPGDWANLGSIGATTDAQGTYVDQLYTDSNGGTVKFPNSSDTVTWYASKIIPKGFKAESFEIHGSAGTVQCFTSSIDASVSFNNSIAGALGGDIAFTEDIIGDGNRYATIAWTPAALNDTLSGGQINISRT